MPDISDLRGTIVPKSDQLNAEQLLGGDMTITVTDVRLGGDEQPVIIHYEHDEGRPFKPSKTVRKILIFAWGEDGRNWIGKSMTLFNDQSVRFGGQTVGGIRISHLSDIQGVIDISLTATKGKKAQHTIQVLQVPKATTLPDVLRAIAAAANKAGMETAKAMAMKLTQPGDIEQAQKAYGDRVRALRAAATPVPQPAPETPAFDLSAVLERIDEYSDTETLSLYLDELRDTAPEDQQSVIADAGRTRLEELEG